VVTDVHGRVVLTGTARLSADANFQIDLKDRTPPTGYTLSALIVVNGNTMSAQILRIPLSAQR
jgi:hypothetical protein